MTNDVCIVRGHFSLDHKAPPGHPENEARFQGLSDLFASSQRLCSLPVWDAKPALANELGRLHARSMIDEILATRGREGWLDSDTFYSPGSADAALLGAGAAMGLAAAIWRGEYRRGFCLSRPPGHHAVKESAMGFCLFNNVALAVAAILEESPQARVAVVDFDLHHGNGTQDAFYENPNVLFISSHRFPYYPGTGALEEIGRGKGKGSTVNFPIDSPYGDGFFINLYGSLVFPLLNEFRPEMIFVSAGFDGHRRDPMQGFTLETKTYEILTDLLIAQAEKNGGKILFVLEGGYNPKALRDSVEVVTERLIAAPRESFIPAVPSTETDGNQQRLWDKFRQFHSSLFPSLR